MVTLVGADLTRQERDKYIKTWQDKQYRVVSPGMRYLDSALGWMNPEPGSSFTDWGCGTGKAATELHSRGFKVQLVDIAVNAYDGPLPFFESCLWELSKSEVQPTDYGFCTDVLEHIPTVYVDEVISGIAERTKRKCYFQIALFHDTHFTNAGPLHLSVFPAEWWMTKLLGNFKTAEFRRVRAKHLLAVCE